jgi:hypothetical protein
MQKISFIPQESLQTHYSATVFSSLLKIYRNRPLPFSRLYVTLKSILLNSANRSILLYRLLSAFSSCPDFPCAALLLVACCPYGSLQPVRISLRLSRMTLPWSNISWIDPTWPSLDWLDPTQPLPAWFDST